MGMSFELLARLIVIVSFSVVLIIISKHVGCVNFKRQIKTLWRRLPKMKVKNLIIKLNAEKGAKVKNLILNKRILEKVAILEDAGFYVDPDTTLESLINGLDKISVATEPAEEMATGKTVKSLIIKLKKKMESEKNSSNSQEQETETISDDQNNSNINEPNLNIGPEEETVPDTKPEVGVDEKQTKIKVLEGRGYAFSEIKQSYCKDGKSDITLTQIKRMTLDEISTI